MFKALSNNTTVYLIRHAEVFNPHRIIYGRLPGFGLSKLGYFQAQKLKQFFIRKKIAAVYSSELLRARKTADILKPKGAKRIIDPIFSELNFIKWQGLTYEDRLINEIEEYVKEPQKIDYLGETLEEAQVRMIDGIYRAIRRYKNKEIIIVSHADPIILTILYFMGKNLSQLNKTNNPNASIYKLVFNEALQCEIIEHIQVAPAKKDWP